MCLGRCFHYTWKLGNLADERDLSRIAEPVEITFGQSPTPQIKIGENVRHVTQHGTRPGVGVLNVEHRVVARLLSDLDEIEIERRVILPVEHHEANRPRAYFVHHIPERDERSV